MGRGKFAPGSGIPGKRILEGGEGSNPRVHKETGDKPRGKFGNKGGPLGGQTPTGGKKIWGNGTSQKIVPGERIRKKIKVKGPREPKVQPFGLLNLNPTRVS